MAEPFRYEAFISYRHRQPDKEWADWLVRALETYAPPGSLREIGKILSGTGRVDEAKALFREAIERAATQGETGSSTVADVPVELAKLGELRAARVSADRDCTASDRLRVYAAFLDPR